MVGLLLLSAAFVAGFTVRGNDSLLDYLGFEATGQSGDSNPGMTVSGNTYDSLSARIAEVQGILEQHSLDSYDLDSTTKEAVSVIADNTNDPYVSYLNDEQYDAYIAASSDSYRGIGVLFSENQGQAYAVDVFAGSEAEAEGVQAGDYIVSITGNKGMDGTGPKRRLSRLSKPLETAPFTLHGGALLLSMLVGEKNFRRSFMYLRTKNPTW